MDSYNEPLLGQTQTPPSPATNAPSATDSRVVPFFSKTVNQRHAEVNLLLVGPEALALQTQTAGLAIGHTATADSIIEAILVSAQGPHFDLIIVGIGQELAHLQRAVESLHGVNPQSRLVLLCTPADEPQARRALKWGAHDYEIIPTSLTCLLNNLPAKSSATPQPASAPNHRLNAAATSAPARPQITLATLPLVLQTTLIDSLLQGQQDLVDRALAIVQGYLTWPGKLSIHQPATPDELPSGAVRIYHQEQVFGYLQLAADPAALTPALKAQLDQSASWLGGWMALSHQNTQLRTLAITDELSGAYNRRYFIKFVNSLLNKARTERFRVTMLLFDIDNFKTYNDQFGHPAGDEIIRQLITLLRRCTRERDLVARIGGDEFAVIFWDFEAPRQPNSEHPRDAVAATERFRKAIADHQWETQCKIKGSVSISGGIASFPWDADNFTDLLATADIALLKAKSAGKNVIQFTDNLKKVINQEPLSTEAP